MKKVIFFLVIFIVVLIGLRLFVMQLAVEEDFIVPVIPAEQPVNTVMEKQIFEPPHVPAMPSTDYPSMVVQDVVDRNAPPLEQGGHKVIETTQPQSPEALFPEVAKLLEASARDYNVDKHQQKLAKYVQSVDPAIYAINQSLQAMQGMQLTLDKQQAYTFMANEKIAALKTLKEQAMAIDPGLMSVSTGVDE